jgi:hypothetical protein
MKSGCNKHGSIPFHIVTVSIIRHWIYMAMARLWKTCGKTQKRSPRKMRGLNFLLRFKTYMFYSGTYPVDVSMLMVLSAPFHDTPKSKVAAISRSLK